jgi:aspartyl-tRNA(Asn)/glutamyl-tRNA(Gln) amidotransferase subunit B
MSATATATESKYETVIGLEVHVELLTKTKLFCGCPNRFGAAPNTQVCPVCLGLPGTLPVLNKRAVELLLMAALATNCATPERSKFDRKNYFYPDMPKNFQISQYDQPLALGGHLMIDVDGQTRRIGITRIHLEEDTGKSTHAVTKGERTAGRIDSAEYTLEDYNRAGVPLAEIVSEPDMRGPDEAVAYLQALRDILRWVGVSDCKMEEGSLRCDANISLRPRGAAQFGTRAEIKNMNSFKSVARAIEYEVKRQAEVLDRGDKVVQETRAWDEEGQVTHSLRSKEEAHDYRYFPEPDLVPVSVDEAWLQQIRQSLPELPVARRDRFVSQYGLSEYDATTLTRTRSMADFFENVVKQFNQPKEVANWLLGEVSRLLNVSGSDIEQSKLTVASFVELLQMLERGVIGKGKGKEVVEAMFNDGTAPAQYVKDKGLEQISDTSQLEGIVKQVLAADPGSAKAFLEGRDKAFKALMGQVMRATSGRANPAVAETVLQQALDSMKGS